MSKQENVDKNLTSDVSSVTQTEDQPVTESAPVTAASPAACHHPHLFHGNSTGHKHCPAPKWLRVVAILGAIFIFICMGVMMGKHSSRMSFHRGDGPNVIMPAQGQNMMPGGECGGSCFGRERGQSLRGEKGEVYGYGGPTFEQSVPEDAIAAPGPQGKAKEYSLNGQNLTEEQIKKLEELRQQEREILGQ